MYTFPKRRMLGLALLLIVVAAMPPSSVGAQEELDPLLIFYRVWERTDRPVEEGQASHTWIWGDELTGGYGKEPYRESPRGERYVKYYDKARMEITAPSGHPAADPASVWYVTNGLLVTEMMTGALQLRHDEFGPTGAVGAPREPAQVNVAGDPDDPNSLTYAGLAGLMDPASDQSGRVIVERVDRAGKVTADEGLAGRTVVYGEFDQVTGHNIAAPFWEFMNSTGTVYAVDDPARGSGGEYIEDALFESAYFATGRPVIEPYWADVLVGGTEKLVLLQCFERRCLTYTPDNPEGWQVEAGNVGRHYRAWRYEGNTGGYEPSGQLDRPRDVLGPGDLEVLADGSTIVIDSSHDRIYRYGADGALLQTITPPEPLVPVYDEDRGLTGLGLDHSGNIYVSDGTYNTILIFGPTGEFLEERGGPGYGPGEFRFPSDIVFDADGNYYVTDSDNSRVQKFASDGSFLSEFGSMDEDDPNYLREPIGLDIGPDGALYVVGGGDPTYAFGYLVKYSPEGEQLAAFNGSESDLNLHASVAVNDDGRALVVDAITSDVHAFTTDLEYQGVLIDKPSSKSSYDSVAIDPANDQIHVSDVSEHRLDVFDANGEPLRSYPDSTAGLLEPIAVEIDAASGRIIVADKHVAGNELRIYQPDGTLEEIWSVPDERWEGYYPLSVDLEFGVDGSLFVLDGGDLRCDEASITAYFPEGDELRTISLEDTCELDHPRTLAVAEDGTVFVGFSGFDGLDPQDAWGVAKEV